MNTKLYTTTDLCQAATIIAATGMMPLNVDGHEPDTIYVVFLDDDVAQVADAYEDGSIRVNPIIFEAAQILLRQRIDKNAAKDAVPEGLLSGRRPSRRQRRRHRNEARRDSL